MTLLIALLIMFQFGYLDFTYSPLSSALKLGAVIVLWGAHVFLVASPKESK